MPHALRENRKERTENFVDCRRSLADMVCIGVEFARLTMAPLSTDPALCIIERLSHSCAPEERRVSGTYQRFEQPQLFLTTDQRLSVASAVTVEYEDVLFLGEVLACTLESEGLWQVLIRVHQLLNGLQSLTILRERLLWDGKRSHLLPLTSSSVLVSAKLSSQWQ